MRKIIVILLLSISLAYANEYKVVFNLTSGEQSQVLGMLIKNIELLKKYYQTQKDSLKTVVVISGDAYDFFRKDKQTALDLKLYLLAREGTEFKVSSLGLKKRGINQSALYDYVVPKFSSRMALMEYKDAGYVYVEVH